MNPILQFLGFLWGPMPVMVRAGGGAAIGAHVGRARARAQIWLAIIVVGSEEEWADFGVLWALQMVRRAGPLRAPCAARYPAAHVPARTCRGSGCADERDRGVHGGAQRGQRGGG